MNEKISAVLIVKNEEATLERCLDSLDGFDQVVVLDTGSTDRTKEIAERCGAEFFTTSPIVPFHFAEARNRALQHAKNDWCLTIDADEVLHGGCHKELRRLIRKNAEIDAIEVNFIMKGELGDKKYPIPKVKVFKKSQYQWQYRVHEMLTTTPGRHVTLNAPQISIEHFPVKDKGPRHSQNLELLKLCVEESPEYSRARRQLALEYMLRKDWVNAIGWFKEWLDHILKVSDYLEISHIQCYLGNAYAELKDIPQAMLWYARACDTAPLRRECPYLAGFHLMAHATKGEHIIAALDYFERIETIPIKARPKFHLEYDFLWNPRDPKYREVEKMADFCRNMIEEAKQQATLQK